jgi:hypothetical protein
MVFLEKKAGQDNKVTLVNDATVKIECPKTSIMRRDLIKWTSDFLKEKGISNKENSFGFFCDDFRITVTTYSTENRPPFFMWIWFDAL